MGYCDVKKVSAINKDGSNGFVKVSRYISKYIAKPKDFCPWIAEGLVEAPRRLCSKFFGKQTIELQKLKSYYQCLDLRNLPINDRLDRVIERSRFISLDGVKFPLPRRLKEELFYTKVKAEDGTTKLEKSPLQRLVVERERVRAVEKFNEQLRQNPLLDNEQGDLLAALEVARGEDRFLRDREARSSAYLLKQLKSDSQ